MIKPEVGAGSLGAKVFDARRSRRRRPPRRADRARRRARPAVCHSVDDYGERSLVWIDGALSHAIRKSPRFSGDRESDRPGRSRSPTTSARSPRPRSRRTRTGSSTGASTWRATTHGQPRGDGARARRAVAVLRAPARRAPTATSPVCYAGLAASCSRSRPIASIVHAPYQNRSLPMTRTTRAAGSASCSTASSAAENACGSSGEHDQVGAARARPRRATTRG